MKQVTKIINFKRKMKGTMNRKEINGKQKLEKQIE